MKTYEDCKRYGFLPKKEKYTMRDVHNVLLESLFKPQNGKTGFRGVNT